MTKPTESIISSTRFQIPSWINRVFQMAVTFMLVYIIYTQVWTRSDIGSLWDTFLSRFSGANLIYLAIVVVLIGFNWAVETQKWHLLIRNYDPISYLTAFKATLAGSTFSIFTPNRLGDYGGRILFIQPANQVKSTLALLVGNMAQFIVIMTLGIVGAIYFFRETGILEPIVIQSIGIMVGVVLVLVLYLFFHMDLLVALLQRIPRIANHPRWKSHMTILEEFTQRQLNQTLGLALLRYGVYSTQYYLLLHFFGIEVAWGLAYAGIAALFFIQSGIPLPAITGLLARGELALLIWGCFTDASLLILGATFTLWVCNLLIPSLLGMICLYKVDVLKSFGYESQA